MIRHGTVPERLVHDVRVALADRLRCDGGHITDALVVWRSLGESNPCFRRERPAS